MNLELKESRGIKLLGEWYLVIGYWDWILGLDIGDSLLCY